MVVWQIFYRVAFFTTALVHLWWNDLVSSAVGLVKLCLSNPAGQSSVVQNILRLHTLVLTCFVAGVCFHAVSASALQGQQTFLQKTNILDFDDVETPDGFGNLTPSYSGFVFDGFYAFEPSHPRLDGVISSFDLNCAVSKPNALYGTRDNFGPGARTRDRRPSIHLGGGTNNTFTVQALKIKPLNMPLGFVTVTLQGFRQPDGLLTWSVDFPAGFHDVLDVHLEEFSQRRWDGLERLEIWADFHYNDVTMDWEFCLDDLDIQADDGP